MLAARSIVVCCGPGGVGKTTVSAALALEAARAGRRAVVVTIDPAKRLADALGIGPLTDAPRRIQGPWPGELWALMLDTKNTFDALVATHAESPEQAARIYRNRFYRNISTTLSGTQEYMASEKLYELHQDPAFDLVVVDTPPSRQALDFIDASRRLTAFLDHRLYRLLTTPTKAYLRAVHLAAQAFVRTVTRVVGSEVLDDALAFFAAFEGMEEGFRERAARVQALLADRGTAFVLVAAPRADAVAESAFLADRLDQAGLGLEALVVNRVQPRFGAGPAEATRHRATELAATPLGPLLANLADQQAMAEGEEVHLAGLRGRVASAGAVAQVPVLDRDVHDLEALSQVGAHLGGGEG